VVSDDRRNAASAGALPGVAIVATGGTIANTAAGRISVDDVLADIRAQSPSADPAMLARLTITEVMREGAAAFTPDTWLSVARSVELALAPDDIHGVVVTHGTYTAEETAYFLQLVVRSPKPVVLACSQRKHGTIGNDGDRNLLDAIRVAADPATIGLGVTLVADETIHGARDVIKTNQRPGGFSSRAHGPLGSVEVDRVSIYRQPSRRHTTQSEFDTPADLPRVDIAAVYAGADGAAIDAFVDAGASGIVINGFAYSGLPHYRQTASLRRAVDRGVCIVLVNRGGGGRIPASTDDGFIRGDDLSAQKARVLLAVALTRTRDPRALQRIFSEY
jgi:L-asparaginase